MTLTTTLSLAREELVRAWRSADHHPLLTLDGRSSALRPLHTIMPFLPVTNCERSPFPNHGPPHIGALITLIKGVCASSRKVHLHSSGVSSPHHSCYSFISIPFSSARYGSTDRWLNSNGEPAGVIWVLYSTSLASVGLSKGPVQAHDGFPTSSRRYGIGERGEKAVYIKYTPRDNCSPFLHTLLKISVIHRSPQPRGPCETHNAS